MITPEEIENRFTYHKPNDLQAQLYKGLRDTAKEFAIAVSSNTPTCRESALALTKIEEAVFWANASIARNSRFYKSDNDGTITEPKGK